MLTKGALDAGAVVAVVDEGIENGQEERELFALHKVKILQTSKQSVLDHFHRGLLQNDKLVHFNAATDEIQQL